MVTCKLWAGLGNQAFMIATVLGYAKKHGMNYFLPPTTIAPHIWKTHFPQFPTQRCPPHYFTYNEPEHSYNEIPFKEHIQIEGYFQSERYFDGYKEQIAEALGFVHKPEPYVAVHIRRGDYLKYPDQFPVMPVEYYRNAIVYLLRQGFSKFKIYSDDISWCTKNITASLGEGCALKDAMIISFSDTKDPLTDMKDMYNASGFILANSTFGLFPALLRSDNPMVIAPEEDRWFGPKAKHLETCDLLPERFIKM